MAFSSLSPAFFVCLSVSSAKLLLALLVQMNSRLPLYCLALCAAGQKYPHLKRPLNAWMEEAWGRENRPRNSDYPTQSCGPLAVPRVGWTMVATGSVTILPPPSVPVVYVALLSALHFPHCFPHGVFLSTCTLFLHTTKPPLVSRILQHLSLSA